MIWVWSFTWFQFQLKIVNANRMGYMIRMWVERLNCATLHLSNTLFTFWNSTIMTSVATKRRAKKSLKELEKGTPHKDVASLFGVPKNTLSTWKKNKDKIFEKYNSGLIWKRVKQEKYKDSTKLCINSSLFYEVKMFQSVDQFSRKRVLNSPEDWTFRDFKLLRDG